MLEKLINYIANRKQYQKDVEAAAEVPRLHGVNLDKWQYLGYTTISFTYSDTKYEDTAKVFMFCDKNDLSKRTYTMVPETTSSHTKERFKSHPWMIETAELWRIGEREYFQPITTAPSRWLQEKMLEDHKCVWSQEKKWWVNDDSAKYESAKRSQAKKKPKEEPEILPVEDNVVKIKFGKDEEKTD